MKIKLLCSLLFISCAFVNASPDQDLQDVDSVDSSADIDNIYNGSFVTFGFVTGVNRYGYEVDAKYVPMDDRQVIAYSHYDSGAFSTSLSDKFNGTVFSVAHNYVKGDGSKSALILHGLLGGGFSKLITDKLYLAGEIFCTISPNRPHKKPQSVSYVGGAVAKLDGRKNDVKKDDVGIVLYPVPTKKSDINIKEALLSPGLALRIGCMLQKNTDSLYLKLGVIRKSIEVTTSFCKFNRLCFRESTDTNIKTGPYYLDQTIQSTQKMTKIMPFIGIGLSHYIGKGWSFNGEFTYGQSSKTQDFSTPLTEAWKKGITLSGEAVPTEHLDFAYKGFKDASKIKLRSFQFTASFSKMF